jgi:hypothetical protein
MNFRSRIIAEEPEAGITSSINYISLNLGITIKGSRRKAQGARLKAQGARLK